MATKQITLNTSSTSVTVSPSSEDIDASSISSTQIKFTNSASVDLTVQFNSNSPFTQSSYLVPHGSNVEPTWASAPSRGHHTYSVNAGQGSNLTGGTGDIDIKTTPLP